MKRTLVGAGLLVAAGIGSVAMAPGGAAQEGEPTWEQLEAHFEPNPAEPGETVTLVPDQPCTFDVDGEHVSEPGVVVIHLGDEEVEVPMEDDGSWSFEITAPEEPGTYGLTAECQNSTYEEERGWCKVDHEDGAPVVEDDMFSAQNISYSRPVVPTWKWFDCKFQYYEAELTVGGDEVPSPTTTQPDDTTPPATPPPATPIVDTPDFTG